MGAKAPIGPAEDKEAILLRKVPVSVIKSVYYKA
jgi:hypothetical protein